MNARKIRCRGLKVSIIIPIGAIIIIAIVVAVVRVVPAIIAPAVASLVAAAVVGTADVTGIVSAGIAVARITIWISRGTGPPILVAILTVGSTPKLGYGDTPVTIVICCPKQTVRAGPAKCRDEFVETQLAVGVCIHGSEAGGLRECWSVGHREACQDQTDQDGTPAKTGGTFAVPTPLCTNLSHTWTCL